MTTEATEDYIRPRGHTKPTRRWCKGKAGVEHDWQKAVLWQIGNFTYHCLRCSKCGKQKAWSR